ncbi:MAG: BadF/BadG/BcrA/BcrD ATPase family protein [Methanocella sp. PtaU1.Bin125]|nr:MAG: BadF/BadG/BcrA/BcrD ATPase family protein [Methanocella sp. PtaU1.Bin125]
MMTAGIDSGSAATKAVLLKGTDMFFRIVPTGFDFRQAARDAYKAVLAEAREQAADHVAVTGYGRHGIEFATKTVTEITAHARGVSFMYPGVKGIIDIGGQDSKVIVVDSGKVADFQMNDKCAAGTGRFLEHTARALEVDVADLGRLALASNNPANISSMCTVFAESEVISLRAQGVAKEDIAAGLVESIARRVAAMAKPMGLKEHVALVGGVAKNEGIRKALERELGREIYVPPEPQITAALGAALLANR